MRLRSSTFTELSPAYLLGSTSWGVFPEPKPGSTKSSKTIGLFDLFLGEVFLFFVFVPSFELDFRPGLGTETFDLDLDNCRSFERFSDSLLAVLDALDPADLLDAADALDPLLVRTLFCTGAFFSSWTASILSVEASFASSSFPALSPRIGLWAITGGGGELSSEFKIYIGFAPICSLVLSIFERPAICWIAKEGTGGFFR